MPSQRQRPLFIAAAAIVLAWLVCWVGYSIAKKSQMTREKLNRYVQSIDLEKMSATERAKALQALVDKWNAMSPEDRRHWHFDRDWLAQLTDAEKSLIIDGMVPAQIKLELKAFEQMPKEQRQRIIDRAMNQIKEASANGGAGQNAGGGDSGLSPELEAKVRTMGLNAIYSQSSAQSKVELAPLLNEIQQQMESGRFGR
jgi:hypothetical protein